MFSVLQSVKIIELSQMPPASLATMILSDFGAEVTRITTISEVKLTTEERRLAAFEAIYRHKKAIALNLKSKEAIEIFHKLAANADVIVEGFRPGVAARLGVDYDTISKFNQRIIYCSVSGYGQDGPYNQLPGHDINYIATSGILSLIGNGGGPPVLPENFLADFAGGSLHAVIGILLALIARGKTGKGQFVDISMTDSTVTLLIPFFSYYFSTGKYAERGRGALNGGFPYYNIYETKDHKYISIGCIEPHFWRNLVKALGKEEWQEHRFKMSHFYKSSDEPIWKEIDDYLRKIFVTRTCEEWINLLSDKDICVAGINSLEEVENDPQIKSRGLIVELEHPEFGKIKQIGATIKLSETPAIIKNTLDKESVASVEILDKLGYNKEAIRRLKRSGVVGV